MCEFCTRPLHFTLCIWCDNMQLLVIFALIALASALPADWPQRFNTYKGYEVLEVIPATRAQADLLRTWMLEKPELDFWQEPSKVLEPVHIMAGPQQLPSLRVNLRRNGMTWTLYKQGIDRELESFVKKEVERRQGGSKVFDINDFNTLQDIMGWLETDLMDMCIASGRVCTYAESDIQSVEGRAIPIITMSSDGAGGKPVFLLDATVHAREWLTPATILKIMEHVATSPETDVVNMLDTHDFVFYPMANPDGYEYTWTNARLWRKNRQDFGNCVGVDLNRNFDYNWGEEGVSTNPCSDLYCGPNGNSEPETLALDAELERYAAAMNAGGAYVTFHSYGYMWMHPWGNTVNHAGQVCERADDHDDMYYVADQTADAIEATHSTRWARGTSCEVIYETTGASDDYGKGVHGIKYPFNPELRGNGFIIDADQIQPSFEEVWAGMVAKKEAIEFLEGRKTL